MSTPCIPFFGETTTDCTIEGQGIDDIIDPSTDATEEARRMREDRKNKLFPVVDRITAALIMLNEETETAEFRSLADQRASCKNEQVLSTWTYLVSGGEATTDIVSRAIRRLDRSHHHRLVISRLIDRS